MGERIEKHRKHPYFINFPIKSGVSLPWGIQRIHNVKVMNLSHKNARYMQRKMSGVREIVGDNSYF
jgi:hypothetical protein